MKVKITINNDKVVTATMEDSQAAKDFVALLPLTLTLRDFNKTEKIIDALPERLSEDDEPFTPVVGDLTYYAIIGTIRHDCLNHLIILNEKHLHKILKSYFDYYHHCRTHLSLEKNAPILRMAESKTQGKVISFSKMGGLHHLYRRAA